MPADRVLSLNMVLVNDGCEDDYLKEVKSKISILEGSPEVEFVYCFKSVGSFTKKMAKNKYIEVIQWRGSNPTKDSCFAYTKGLYQIQSQGVYKQASGEGAKLSDLVKSGYAIEFGARRVKEGQREVFSLRREEFIKRIRKLNGFRFDLELTSVESSEDTMIVVGWQSINDFKKAGLKSLLSISILWQMLRYFPLIEMIDFQVGVLGDDQHSRQSVL